MGIDITSLIFTILSFIATVGVTLTLFWIERKNQKKRDKEEKEYRERREREEAAYRERREKEEKEYRERREREEIEQKAREFIINNSEELEYLPIAQFAVYLNPHVKHCRKIYNEFSKCSIQLQQEILNEREVMYLNLKQYDRERLKDKLLTLFEEDAKKLALMTRSFLYDGAKYFHRGFERYKSMKIFGNFEKDRENKEDRNNYYELKFYSINHKDCNKRFEEFYLSQDKSKIKFTESKLNQLVNEFINYENNHEFKEDYIRKEDYFIGRRLYDYYSLYNGKINIKTFVRTLNSGFLLPTKINVDAYAYYRIPDFIKFQDLHKVPPLDYYFDLITNVAESECTYIVMRMVQAEVRFVRKHLYHSEEDDIPYGDLEYSIERNEDLYYSILQLLYDTYKSKIKEVLLVV